MILKPDLKFDSPHFPAQFGALVTLRTGGVSFAPYDDGTGTGGFNLADHVGDQSEHVVRNRALLREFLPSDPQWLTQVHSNIVLNLDDKPSNLVADACITTQANVVCAVLTADCLPVLFCDATNGVVGAAHAGWRGLADGVLENTVAAMRAAGADPKEISVWFGPAIGPLKFEVGEEVRARFVDKDACAVDAFVASASQSDKFYANIYQLARIRLEQVGIEQFTGGQFCTVSEPERFYSYRRDGLTGRMASVIWRA